MLLRFTLTEADAKRYDVTFLDFDLGNPRIKEIRELGRQCGLTWNELQDRLPATESDGQAPDIDLEAAGIVMWLAALRAGVDVAWNDFDLDLYGTKVERADDDPNLSAPDGA